MRLPYRFGRYTLVERIAAGGTAEIYRALVGRGRGARDVAVKRLLPSWGGNAEIEAMLMDEARVLSHLSHPAIVRVHEHGMAEGNPFIAMEYVDGMDCARLLAESVRDGGPPPLRIALYIVEQVLLALEFAHRSSDSEGRPLGVVHRDISPQNILLAWDGRVKVTDFGIAKGAHRTRMTELGQLKGKYAYMAPEQAMGMQVDCRADIFACGIVLWELVFARRLFEGESEVEVLERVRMMRSVPGDMRSLSPDLAGTLMLALAPDPARRYRGALEMLCDLRRAAVAAGGMATCYDLAGFLRERFSPEAEEEFAPARDQGSGAGLSTKPMGMSRFGSGRKICAMALRAAGLAATLGLAAISPPSRGGVAVAQTSPAQAEGVVLGATRLPPPAAMPERRGAVAIDTDPPGASGTLRIGDSVVRFKSPFARGDIEIGDGVRGFAEIETKGFKPARLEFKLDPLNPAFVKKVSLEREAHSTLSIHARPWGIVDIEGAISGREAPAVASGLKAGSYTVTVTHPPTGERASGRVTVKDGASKRCVATFSARPELKCF